MYTAQLTCARPLLAECDVPQFPYSFYGSCFLIRQRTRLYAVTAAHCLENQQLKPDDLRIPYAGPADEFVPISRIHKPATDEEDKDHVDFVLLEVDQERVPVRLEGLLAPWHLPDRAPCSDALRAGRRLVCRGFPFELGDISYERKAIVRRGFMTEGEYSGPSLARHCHTFTFLNNRVVGDINGMSGAPVFTREITPAGPRAGQLVGVLIRGDAIRPVGHFIGWRVLCTMLNKIQVGSYGRASADA